ncbi:hypothetical protein [Pseudomonas sp. 6D_7.1_Bac1]|uniref:hypothetical protein n=1 Tax=Pseudomonas sp. 6D_7.1_Bac1 TaxID=2971615 RepID=UPI0021C9074B|nr:hypothetical protein [Pseudomonas sp. 6D_7.1_Bac1]MCU1752156.1 hypothetical protein [Pseudomonas sp. 6D_7.1_Bac1]
MAVPYEYSLEQAPVDEVLNRQTDYQLVRNYAQGTHSVYELNDEQFHEISVIVFGSGSVFKNNWVEGRPVTINGERLLWIKGRGDHVKIVTTVHT